VDNKGVTKTRITAVFNARSDQLCTLSAADVVRGRGFRRAAFHSALHTTAFPILPDGTPSGRRRPQRTRAS